MKLLAEGVERVRVNLGDPTPGYVQIAEHLRSAIERRELTDGAQLPSLRELAESYGASAGTARRQGQGVFVRRPRRHRRDARDSDEYSFESSRRGEDLLEVTAVGAPADVAARLGIASGSSVVLRRRLRTLDGEPAQMASSYFPTSLVQGSRLADFEAMPDSSAVAELQRVTGRRLGYVAEELAARMPKPEEARTLRLPPGTPVVDLVRTVHDTDDNPLEVAHCVFDGSRHLFAYRIPREVTAP